MSIVQNFPFFSIILAMFSGIISSVLPGKRARNISLLMIAATTALSFAVLCFCMRTGESYTYMMGHFPAPWGNEIRAGVLEGLTASMFGIVMFLSVLGGVNHTASDVEGSKLNLFYIMIDLMLSSLLALVYTNDLFTAYVFVEINTIAGCGLIMIRQKRKSMSAAIRYMIMSQLGSGLFLIGLSMLYDVTGHLLMSPARESAALILDSGSYTIPMLVILAVISVYPFHYLIPDTYGYATPTASAVLSGLVSKGYIFLLIKIFYRVLGENFVIGSHLINVLYCFGVAGMVMGSVHAIAEKDTRRMIAYSSVAQIGYIYMGIGMGTGMGMVAAVFHIFTHSITKALLFISAVGLYEVSGNRTDYHSLRGAAYRNPLAGIGFAVGSLSMVGFPMLSGFISKLLFATSALHCAGKMLPTIIVLAVSTTLNAVYFLRRVITLYSRRQSPAGDAGAGGREAFPVPEKKGPSPVRGSWMLGLSILCLIGLNLFLGTLSQPIVQAIADGLAMFD